MMLYKREEIRADVDLKKQNLSQLNAQRRMMNGPIIREICDAIKKMNKNKSCVPDGLLTFYKYFPDEFLLP